MSWVRAGLLGLLLALGSACSDETGAGDARAQRIEERLLVSCSCHPRRIAGLPIEQELRVAIRVLVEQGLDDDTILWTVFQQYGSDLLRAGVQDVELRANAALAEIGGILLLTCAVLLLQLRR